MVILKREVPKNLSPEILRFAQDDGLHGHFGNRCRQKPKNRRRAKTRTTLICSRKVGVVLEITDYDLSEAEKLQRIFNSQIADVPYCYAIQPEEFKTPVHYQWRKRNLFGNLSQEKIIVAKHGGKPIGFAHVAKATEENGPLAEFGVIRFLIYRQGEGRVGQAILEEAERYLLQLGLSSIKAFGYCYGFYRFGTPSTGISDRLTHVTALFGVNEYRLDSWDNDDGGKTQRSIFMHLPEYQVEEPNFQDSQVELCFKHQESKGNLPNLNVQAFRQGNEIGFVRTYSAGDFWQAKEAQGTCFTAPLFVYEQERGKGIGKYLMQGMLWEMQKMGFQNATLSVAETNFRARFFYANMGYQTVDTSYKFVKEWEA